jgi:hypothetical protein
MDLSIMLSGVVAAAVSSVVWFVMHRTPEEDPDALRELALDDARPLTAVGPGPEVGSGDREPEWLSRLRRQGASEATEDLDEECPYCPVARREGRAFCERCGRTLLEPARIGRGFGDD